jgi:hypothetical protein
MREESADIFFGMRRATATSWNTFGKDRRKFIKQT